MDQLSGKDTRRFGRFQLLLEMAQGGMATLFLARLSGPVNFQKLVVIKKIHDHLAGEQEFIEMFQDEARIAALIHHPNVATIFDMGTVDKSYYIAMEYVHGHSMAEFMRTAKRIDEGLPWTIAARMIADAAAGLHAAHELTTPDGRPLNVVHRDVSPQNLLMTYDGHVKVVDFGIAYAAEKISHTSDGTIKGKIAYMSPEQASSAPLDRRSDVFSLGIILYEAVTMKRLFKARNDAATLYRVLECVVPPPTSIQPDVPSDLEAIIMKALAKDPEQRYSSAGELEQALGRLLLQHGEMASHQDVGVLMTKYFEDQKKLKAEQIQRALEEDHEEPMKAYGMSGEVSSVPNGFHTDSIIQQTIRKPVSMLSLVSAGLGIAFVVVIAAIFLITPGEESAGAEKRERGPMEGVAAAEGGGNTRRGSSGLQSKQISERQGENGGVEADGSMEAGVGEKDEKKGDGKKAKQEKPRAPEVIKISVIVHPRKAKAKAVFRGKTYEGKPLEFSVAPSSKNETLRIKAKGYYSESFVLIPEKDKELILNLRSRPRENRRQRPARKTRPTIELKNIPM